MSLVKQNKAPPADTSNGAGDQGNQGAPQGKHGQEQDRFEGTRPDHIPEKFWKDGKLNDTDLLKSYTELESWKNTKTEDLLKQIKDENAGKTVAKPEDFKMEPIEGIDAAEVEKNPMVQWWRKTAHESGLSQEAFAAGVKTYNEAQAAGEPDMAAEVKSLGENAQVRIDAVNVWANATFTDAAEFAAIQRVATTAAGIKVIEKLMGGKTASGGNDDTPGDTLTIAKLNEMQQDPRYWNASKRDPEFVKQVDAGFQKLYGKK